MSRGFDAGASFFMYKPLDRERLLMIVRATQGTIEHEHRRTRRVPVHSRVLLKHEGHVIESVDVSMEGVLVKAQRVVPVGSSVDIRLQLNKNMGPIVGVGSVVRVAGANFARLAFSHCNCGFLHRCAQVSTVEISDFACEEKAPGLMSPPD